MSVEKMLVALSNTTAVTVTYYPPAKQWCVGTASGSVWSPVLKEAVRVVYEDGR